METFDATVYHRSLNAKDDRPAYLKDGPYVLAVDTETKGLEWWAGGTPFIATASDYDRDYLYRFDDAADVRSLRKALLEADVLIFHNASFDIHVLVQAGVVTMEEIMQKDLQDTDLLSRCVLGTENGPFGLKRLATEYVSSDADEPETAMREAMVSMGIIKKIDQRDVGEGAYYKVWKAYPSIVEHYARMDTRYTYDLYHVMMDKASADDLTVYRLEMEVMPTIIQMEHTGVELQGSKVEDLIVKYEGIAADTEQRLIDLNGGPINFKSNPQVADFLVNQGVPLSQKTETGELRVDIWALEKFKDDYEAVEVLFEFRQARKFLDTYLLPMQGSKTIHTSFWQIGARTGRMSSSRPNLQNIPVRSGPEIREVFVPREGYSFIVADYSSIELRLLAFYMADETLWNVIETGDPFVWLGTQIYGTDDQSEWPVTRSKLKNGYYALTYGAGGPKLASTIGGGMTPAQGKALAQRMKQALGKNYKDLTKGIRKQIESYGYVKTLSRRTQHVSPDKAYVGLNALIQGSAADIMKRGLIDAAAALKEFGGYPVLVVHDEIVAEVPTEHAEQALETLCQAMKGASEAFGLGEHKLDLEVSGTVAHNSYAEGK